MKNKTLGAWTIGTLLFALAAYLMGFQDLAGFVILGNWVFTIMAGNRLMTEKND